VHTHCVHAAADRVCLGFGRQALLVAVKIRGQRCKVVTQIAFGVVNCAKLTLQQFFMLARPLGQALQALLYRRHMCTAHRRQAASEVQQLQLRSSLV
jgi:hypothetical protein